MPTLLQHFQRIDTKLGDLDDELASKLSPPADGGTFNPVGIDLTQGQIEYDSYTQTSALAFALSGSPTIGGAVTVNIRGGGFPVTYPSNFIGLEGLRSGTVLDNGVNYPFYFRAAIDWIEASPGVFEDRVLVGAIGIGQGGGLTPTAIITSAYTAAAGQLLRLDSSAGSFAVTLPPNPQDGDSIAFFDIHGTWTANAITILRNGKTIGGVTDDILLDRDVRMLVLNYDDGNGDWVAEFTSAFTALGQIAASLVLPIMLTEDAASDLTHVGPDKVVVTDVADSVTYTLQPFSVSGIPLYSVINLDRRGSGDLNVAAGAGVTLSFASDRLASLRAPKTGAVLYHDPLDTWQLRGELDEA